MKASNLERVRGMLSADPSAVKSMHDLVYKSTDLTDAEVTEFGRAMGEVSSKYSHKTNSKENLEALRDEILTRSAEIGILVEVDPSPCFYGNPPEVVVLGKVAGDDLYKYGFDHEQKAYEVTKAKERGEDWLGQKESPKRRG
jgi:hypothetical protein